MGITLRVPRRQRIGAELRNEDRERQRVSDHDAHDVGPPRTAQLCDAGMNREGVRPVVVAHDPAIEELLRRLARARVDDRLGDDEQRQSDEELRVRREVGEKVRRRDHRADELLTPREKRNRDPGERNDQHAALHETKSHVIAEPEMRVGDVQRVVVEKQKRRRIGARYHGSRAFTRGQRDRFGAHGVRVGFAVGATVAHRSRHVASNSATGLSRRMRRHRCRQRTGESHRSRRARCAR